MNLLKELFNLREDDPVDPNAPPAPADQGAPEEDKPAEPKVIAKADQYKVELDDDEQVHLMDGEETILVSMPLVIWKQLMRQ